MYDLLMCVIKQIVERGGRPCGCGQRGCWEAYASATAVVARAREALAAASASASASVLAAIPPERLTAKDVFDAAYDAADADALAARVVEEVRREGGGGEKQGRNDGGNIHHRKS